MFGSSINASINIQAPVQPTERNHRSNRNVHIVCFHFLHRVQSCLSDAMAGFDPRPFAIPAVICLISFLSYSSQYLFSRMEPRPLSHNESMVFNINVICIFICYARAILSDPGRVPKIDHDEKELGSNEEHNVQSSDGTSRLIARLRWCRACENKKPPRSHHCKACKRYE
jgi:palmitoyltransferase